MKKDKIIIIGAGISGISAAVCLAKKGYSVDIFETKNFIGGRAYSFEFKQRNEIIDNGQHLFMSAYEHFLNLLNEFGTDRKLDIQDSLKIKFCSAKRNNINLTSYPFSGKIGMLYGLLKMHNLSFFDKINLLDFMINLQFTNKLKRQITVLEFLKSKHQEDNIINVFWQPLCLAVMNLSADEADANLFIKVLKTAFFSNKHNSKLIFSSVNLSELIAPFPNWLNKYKGKIHFQSKVNKILINNNEVEAILVNGQKYFADYYISTVQPYILKNLLTDNIDKELSTHLLDYQYSTIVSIYLWLDGEIIDDDFAALLGTKTQWIFNLNKIHKRTKSNDFLYALTISNANELIDMNNAGIMDICWKELINLFPNAVGLKICDYIVLKNKKATFKANPIIASKRLDSDIGISNFFIAGDWTNTQLPATIEGACISGIKAGENIISKNMRKK